MHLSRRPSQSRSPIPYIDETRIASASISMAALMNSCWGTTRQEGDRETGFSKRLLQHPAADHVGVGPIVPMTTAC